MPLQVKQFDCPNCNSPLDVKNAARSKSIICPSCGSQIDLTSGDYAIIGRVGARPAPQMTQFQLGMQGVIQGESFQIIGRVVYHDDEDNIWDEWLLLSQAGEYVWISDSANEGMALWRGFVPPEPVEPAKVEEGDVITLRGERIRVRDVGSARIDYLEGELTWKATAGNTMNFIEADSARQRISIEFTENEVEFYGGERVDANAVAQAFGAARIAFDAGQFRAAATVSKGISLVTMMVVIGCIALMCIIIAFAGEENSSQAAAPVCVTPVAVGTLVPGAPTPEPVCYTPTPKPRSSGGVFIPLPSGGRSSSGSTRSGSSGGRSTSGGGGSRGGGK